MQDTVCSPYKQLSAVAHRCARCWKVSSMSESSVSASSDSSDRSRNACAIVCTRSDMGMSAVPTLSPIYSSAYFAAVASAAHSDAVHAVHYGRWY